MSRPPRLALPTKPVFTLAIVAAPPTREVFPNPTSLQWITVRVLILTLFKRYPAARPTHPLPQLNAGFTGPSSIMLVPLFLFRALRQRTIASWVHPQFCPCRPPCKIGVSSTLRRFSTRAPGISPTPTTSSPRSSSRSSPSAHWSVPLGYRWVTPLFALVSLVIAAVARIRPSI